jgi:hypothetical protein
VSEVLRHELLLWILGGVGALIAGLLTVIGYFLHQMMQDSRIGVAASLDAKAIAQAALSNSQRSTERMKGLDRIIRELGEMREDNAGIKSDFRVIKLLLEKSLGLKWEKT